MTAMNGNDNTYSCIDACDAKVVTGSNIARIHFQSTVIVVYRFVRISAICQRCAHTIIEQPVLESMIKRSFTSK